MGQGKGSGSVRDKGNGAGWERGEGWLLEGSSEGRGGKEGVGAGGGNCGEKWGLEECRCGDKK